MFVLFACMFFFFLGLKLCAKKWKTKELSCFMPTAPAKEFQLRTGKNSEQKRSSPVSLRHVWITQLPPYNLFGMSEISCIAVSTSGGGERDIQ